MQERRSNADRSHDTCEALLKAARALFLDKGYAATGTPEVAERARVTRGALYHHFTDKRALFQAVVEAEASQIAAEIEADAEFIESPAEALLHGAKAYFLAMQRSGRVRLMLLEGPAVLGAQEMRRIDLKTGGLELRRGIAEARGPDAVPSEIDANADLVSAMFDRAALACDAGADRNMYETTLANILLLLVQGPSAGVR
jgi:AcrR family transcriptional regulator